MKAKNRNDPNKNCGQDTEQWALHLEILHTVRKLHMRM